MLVLTRKLNQSIMIGDDVEIVVIEMSGNQVRLGIKAPRHVKVNRREVFEAKALEAAGLEVVVTSEADSLSGPIPEPIPEPV